MSTAQVRNRDPRIRFLAIALIAGALLWSFLFASYVYAGIITGTLAVVWFFVVLKRRQDALEQNFQRLFSNKDVMRVDKKATFKGQRSHRFSQTQGVGYLVLTCDELYFEMGLLDKVLSIPVGSITGVDQSTRMLGAGTIKPMLKVELEAAMVRWTR
ncbi:MAG: hypothetical protein OES38_03585 [Gammaproteobacteria bacterium]|nr:hypothetical protein [Gammaproteobacteria bacterium]